VIPALEAFTGEKFPPADQLHTEDTNSFLRGVCEKLNIQCSEPKTNARLIDKLVGEGSKCTCSI
jgi:lysyl-tRNA synthetase class 2